MHSSDAEAPHELKRTLGFWALTIYGVGDILGAGIYALVGKVAAEAGDRAWLAFGATIVIALLTALSYAELGGRLPRAAGVAYFCDYIFRMPSLALLMGYLVFASGLVSMATVSLAFAGYLREPLPDLGAWVGWLAIVGFLLMLAVVNFSGMKFSSLTNIICTAIEFSGLLLVVVVGLLFLARGGGDVAVVAAAPGGEGIEWGAIFRGSALAFFAFIGFEDMVNVAEETHRPERNLPLAILTALGVAAVLYMLIAWIATAVVPTAELAASSAPLLEVVKRAAPWVPAWLFVIIALVAVSNTALLNFIMGSRLLFGMSRQQLLPAWLGVVHRHTRTPHRAILVMFVLALILALSGTLKTLAGTTNVLLLIVFFTVNIALATLKLREPPPAAGFRVPILVPIAGALSCAGLIFFVPYDALRTAAVLIAIGLVIVAIFWLRTPPDRRSELDLTELE